MWYCFVNYQALRLNYTQQRNVRPAGYGAGKEKPGWLFFHPGCGCPDNHLRIILGCTIKAVFFVHPTLKGISFALGRKKPDKLFRFFLPPGKLIKCLINLLFQECLDLCNRGCTKTTTCHLAGEDKQPCPAICNAPCPFLLNIL
jgi:hypothetical protein